MYFPSIALCSLVLTLSLCSTAHGVENKTREAEASTRAAQEKVFASLPFEDATDFEDARRGYIGQLDDPILRAKDGKLVFSMPLYDFLRQEKAPDTVNPSLWRQARLNMEGGLFKVTEGIYQIRALDISNMTIIEGDSGLLLIDPLTSSEAAAAGLKLYYDLVPGPGGERRPVHAVIYTHSHADHYGGVKGVISEEDVAAGRVAVLAPEGFMEAAISENVLAGNAMNRRSQYMYGTRLPRNPRGHVDAGLGKNTSHGSITLIAPTDSISKTGEKRSIDGVEIEFLMAPDTEAPAEMLMFFPKFKAICAAEDACHTLHNLYTLRGAQVRDANNWWRAIDQTIDLFAGRAEVLFAQHHWPLWGRDRLTTFLQRQRNAYKYLHDQTLRLANQGHTPREISEMLDMPASLAREWHLRDYYGSVRHNIKAVYQRYLGWYDGHPANLNPLPPQEAAGRYVAFMGGAEAVLEKARQSFSQGDYRWVAEVMTHVVFQNPENMAARQLQADALEQLGYQAESAPWRNVYLMGAQELRMGISNPDKALNTASPDVTRAMNPEMVLDYLAIHLNGEKAEGKTLRFAWNQPDNADSYLLSVEDSVLLYKKNAIADSLDAQIIVSKDGLSALIAGACSLDEGIDTGMVRIEGSLEKVRSFFAMLDGFPPFFPIVTP